MASEVRVEGLETLDYLDNLQSRARFTEQGDALTFESEVSSSTLFLYVLLVTTLYSIESPLFGLNRWTRYILALHLK